MPNQLIDQSRLGRMRAAAGSTANQETKMSDKDGKNDAPARCWLYRKDCPAGAVFEGEAIDKAREAGWSDTPPKDAAPPRSDSDLAGKLAAAEARIEKLVDELSATKAEVTELEEKIIELESGNKPAGKARARK